MASEIDITIYVIIKDIEKKNFEVQSQDHFYISKNIVRKWLECVNSSEHDNSETFDLSMDKYVDHCRNNCINFH